jgi:glycosyltransferase involved in cell wall biosynthesis
MGLGRARLRRRRSGRFLVRFEGEFGYRHSFGHVAREMALALLGRPEIELRLLIQGPMEFRLEDDARTWPLAECLDPDPQEEVDFHIRHHWPPNFTPPPSGRWILAQPWEYGSLPESWVSAFREGIDDAWCFTRYVKDAFLRAGFPIDRTPVVPHGIDADTFRPDLEPLELPTERKFKFLYVGGTLERKGADVLLRAYLSTFSRMDDVTLVVKDLGTQTFYRGQTIHARILDALKDSSRPEIVYLDGYLSDHELARLYNACDVLVAPYRGEGFALPVLEAMACGLHVIATAGGATDDFLDGTCGSRIVSERREGTQVLSDGTRCVAPLFMLEPDPDELQRLLRWANEHPEAGKRLGRAASRRARLDWTWERVGEIAVERLRKLSERPIRRFSDTRPGIDPPPDNGSPAMPQRLPCQPEDPGKLRALEIALLRGEIDPASKYLDELAAKEEIDPQTRSALLLAEKTLSSEKSFVLKGFPSERRAELLASVRSALGRILSSSSRGEVEVSGPRVSLTMIVRNEEENLGECLKSVRHLVDEMVVVDTGSNDRTKVIASSLGAKVFDFTWVDSFARARNESLAHATGEWIFWLDADDRLDPENGERLKAVFSGLPRARIIGYSMKVECVARRGGSATVVDHVRLFPRHSGLRWEYRVHENILPSINRLGGEIRWTDVTIHHYGYLDASLREKKRRRDQALLLKNIEELPEDPFIHFNLGHSFIDEGDLERAAHHLRESISRSEPHYSQVKKAYALLAQVERNRGELEKAIKVLEEGRRHHPENPELLYFSGVFLHERGALTEAQACFERILESQSWPKEFSSFDVGILGHKTQHRLAMVLDDLGKTSAAESLLDEVRRTNPDYLPGLVDLAALRIRSNKLDQARPLIEEIRSRGLVIDAAYLEGRLLFLEGRLEEGMNAFEKTLELEPHHDGALLGVAELSRKLGDMSRAEEALRKRAELHPRSAEARHALAWFLWEQGGADLAIQELERALTLDPHHAASLALKNRFIDGEKSRAGPHATGGSKPRRQKRKNRGPK